MEKEIAKIINSNYVSVPETGHRFVSHKATLDIVKLFENYITETDRYSVCKFPSLGGSPIKSNNKIFAYILGIFRKFSGGEIRIIDNYSGEHIVL